MEDVADLIDGVYASWGGTSGGSANAQTITVAPSITAHTTGQVVGFIAGFSNTTTTPTINVNSIAATTVKFLSGKALVPGAIQSGRLHRILWDGTNWILLNPYTGWQSFTPSLSASGSMTTSSFTNRESRARIDSNGGTVEFETTGEVTLGGTAGTSVYITLPYAAIAHASQVGFSCAATENGGTQVANGGRWRVDATPRVILFKPGVANWTVGSTVATWSIKGSYELG